MEAAAPIGGCPADAEDLVQDAALRARQHLAELRDQTAGRAWFSTILLHTHLNRRRAQRRRPETTAGDLDGRAGRMATRSAA